MTEILKQLVSSINRLGVERQELSALGLVCLYNMLTRLVNECEGTPEDRADAENILKSAKEFI